MRLWRHSRGIKQIACILVLPVLYHIRRRQESGKVCLVAFIHLVRDLAGQGRRGVLKLPQGLLVFFPWHMVLGGGRFQALFQGNNLALQLATLLCSFVSFGGKLPDFCRQPVFFRDKLLASLVQAGGILLVGLFGCFKPLDAFNMIFWPGGMCLLYRMSMLANHYP